MLHAESGGTGETLLVFLHGGSGIGRLGAALLDRLADQVSWWAVDLPGHGESSWTPGAYDPASAADAVAAWARETLPGPAWWYGHSYGGQVALATTGRHPDLACGLIIGDAPLAPEPMYDLLATTAPMLRRWRQWCGRPVAELVELLGAERAGAKSFAETYGPRHRYLLTMAEALHRHDPAFIDALVDHSREVYECLAESGDWLAATRAPVLLLRADPAVLRLSRDEDAELVRRHAAEGSVVTVPGASHGLHHFDPDGVAKVIAEFLSSH